MSWVRFTDTDWMALSVVDRMVVAIKPLNNASTQVGIWVRNQPLAPSGASSGFSTRQVLPTTTTHSSTPAMRMPLMIRERRAFLAELEAHTRCRVI